MSHEPVYRTAPATPGLLNIVRGDPYKCEVTKLPSYFLYMYFVVNDILVKLRKGGPFQMWSYQITKLSSPHETFGTLTLKKKT